MWAQDYFMIIDLGGPGEFWCRKPLNFNRFMPVDASTKRGLINAVRPYRRISTAVKSGRRNTVVASDSHVLRSSTQQAW